MLFGVLKDDVMDYFKSRSRYGFAVIFLLCAILTARLAHLQVFQYEELARLSENNRVRMMPLKADRGFIKDRNGFLLVRNAPGYEVEMMKEDVPDIEALLDRLSPIVEFDRARVLRAVNQSKLYEPVRIARGLSFEQFSYLMQHSAEYVGVQFNIDPIRSYVDGDVFSHSLGYLAEVAPEDVDGPEGYQSGDIVGKSGIERAFDVTLRGTAGVQQVEVDNVGRITEVLSQEAPVPGKNVILTIDYGLQNYISELMDGRAGAVVVLDNIDNSVLAMYSAPTYDISYFAPFITTENWDKLRLDSKNPLLNRTVEGAYPPGSVFKILVALAGLSEGIITPDTDYYCSGSYKFGPRSNIEHRCWRAGGHGAISLRRALSESCDVYFYNLGVAVGIDKLHEYATKYGLGHLSGIALPNEKTGVFPSKEWKLETLKEQWWPGETVNISIGQGYTTTTPLQIAIMYASIFNGGTVYVPRIVDAYEDPLTGERERLPSEVLHSYPIDPKISNVIMEGIVSGVEDGSGTAWRGRVKGLRYGGKTGTAQVIGRWTDAMRANPNLVPENFRDHSWYAGIYPADKPRYAVVVMVEHGGSGGA
ncbi:MAG: penicillin-binding protein 2, partial [Deferribacteraceae bacterium]|nr:penicillin-binding protein 2 [Deferribacteraceae bacterium]